MPNASAHDRACEVLRRNKYLVLATDDEHGPWAAALAFTLVPPRAFCFVSQTASRHGSAIAGHRRIAGVIFDSTASAEEVESIQFAGSARVVKDVDRIAMVLGLGGGKPDKAEVERIAHDPSVAMYELTVEEAHVLDQAAWIERGVDAREPVDFDAVAEVVSGEHG
ncbi:MAG TPA: pyridoxamine 5'-phosphate oxidase family protein [Solirubrobacterales bacterium]|nr:pyridoxamine 5'-phosphate oxidase family protein [Solirubrobacterales bacterium]